MGKQKLFWQAAALFGFFLIWHLYVELFNVPHYLLPAPRAFLANFWRMTASGELWRHTVVTFQEVLLGTLIGGGLGIISGYILAKNRLLERIVAPYILIAQTAPKISLAPLFILWFGLDIASKVVLVALVVFFPIMVNVVVGVRSVSQDLMALMTILQASRWQRFKALEIPSTLPELLGGLRIAITQAVVAAIIGELMGAKAGLGYLLILGQEMYDIQLVLTAVVAMCFLGLFVYYMVLLLERRVLYWQGDAQN